VSREAVAGAGQVADGHRAVDAAREESRRFLAVQERAGVGRAGGRQYDTEEDREAMRHVLQHWIFPLTHLDLSLAKVEIADLKRTRARWLAHEMGAADEL